MINFKKVKEQSSKFVWKIVNVKSPERNLHKYHSSSKAPRSFKMLSFWPLYRKRIDVSIYPIRKYCTVRLSLLSLISFFAEFYYREEF